VKSTNQDVAAPVTLRVGIYLLSTVLTFLLIWLLGFVLRDLGNLKGPDFREVSGRHVDPALAERVAALERQIGELDLQVGRQREIQQNLRQSMDNARETMQQMMSLHRLSLEQKVTPSDTEREALATSQKRFLDAQERFEQANEAISQSNRSKFDLNQEVKSVRSQIDDQNRPAQLEYDRLLRGHRLQVASLKLAFIVPLFLLASWAVYRYRRSPYRPVTYAVVLATFWKLGTVMFDHFPREFFKYIAISAGILIVVVFLIWMLRRSVRPGRLTRLKRFREAYAAHRCPLCAYPIARGALRYAVWTRKGPKLVTPTNAATRPEEPPTYACPSCGTKLFAKCEHCGSVRHSLLPYCDACGREKPVPELEPETNVSGE
jgi:predicted RNA-binding Zn-ribbon protein involved in translation (DUF1610 family)